MKTSSSVISPISISTQKRVHDIDLKDKKYIRAGIIPFTIQGGVKFYAFGVEDGVAAIGDFGGHFNVGEADILDTAIREYQEEALNVFGELTRNMLYDCYVLDGTDTVEILVPVPGPLYEYTEKFRALIGDNTKHEVQSIIWLSRKQLLTAIDSPQVSFDGTKIFHMYNRIYNTIEANREFI